jgi:hypothetical protein
MIPLCSFCGVAGIMEKSIKCYKGASRPTWGVTLSNYGLYPQDTSLIERVEHPGLPGILCHSVKLWTLLQDTSLIERVKHPGLPGVLRHSVKLWTLWVNSTWIGLRAHGGQYKSWVDVVYSLCMEGRGLENAARN